MKNTVLFAAILFIMSVFPTLSQDSNNLDKKSAINQDALILKPKIQAGDFAFAFNLINTVMISPQEVDAFIALKKQLQPVVDKIQKDSPQSNAILEFDISLGMANNFLEFLSRSKFPSAEAERYKRVENAFVESAKNVK